MRILVIEDTPLIASQIQQALQAEGFAVDTTASGEEGQYLGMEIAYDAVVLDLGLPDRDGMEILRYWRLHHQSFPVLILTARDAWHEKVAGIDAGADDYLTKPFHQAELTARVRALIRRAHGQASAHIVVPPFVLDTLQKTIAVHEKILELTSFEYRLLAYFLHRPDHVLSQTELLAHLYEEDYDPDSNTIEVFIARLRKKIPTNTIVTVRGQGYKLSTSPKTSG